MTETETERNLLAYHRSIAHELCAIKGRVKSLIGDVHWLSVGESKETILRNVLSRHLSETLRIGRGFVCFAEDGTLPNKRVTSYQIDILITRFDKPTLYKENDLVFVTPDCVSAIIEVKSSAEVITSGDPLLKLADDVEKIREYNPDCKAGLFIYDNDNPASPSDRTVLRHLYAASKGNQLRAVDWVAVGPNRFFRFWANGSEVGSKVEGAVWHSYELRRLAHSYFVANAAWDTSDRMDMNVQYAWFPVDGGKEKYRRHHCDLATGSIGKYQHP